VGRLQHKSGQRRRHVKEVSVVRATMLQASLHQSKARQVEVENGRVVTPANLGHLWRQTLLAALELVVSSSNVRAKSILKKMHPPRLLVVLVL
jgi:hypothetical protein